LQKFTDFIISPNAKMSIYFQKVENNTPTPAPTPTPAVEKVTVYIYDELMTYH
jgi:hypothetical protein